MSRSITRMTIEDALHYTAEQRDAIIKSYPAHEREARTKGIPSLGSGRVFPIEESRLRIGRAEIPRYWARINGLDFGWDHPTAGCGLAWDRDSDCVYVVNTYRAKEQPVPIHAAAVKAWGDWIPTAWPHDGLQHDKGSGDQLAAQYKSSGLNMLHEHATHEEGGYGVEAGIQDMLERMETERFKVMEGNELFFDEFRLYHREDGKIVKLRDDVLSACRYALMMKRFAEVKRSVGMRPRVGGGGYRF